MGLHLLVVQLVVAGNERTQPHLTDFGKLLLHRLGEQPRLIVDVAEDGEQRRDDLTRRGPGGGVENVVTRGRTGRRRHVRRKDDGMALTGFRRSINDLEKRQGRPHGAPATR